MANNKSEIGDIAEDTVTSWASQIGSIPTPPRRDRLGWDLLLEFPPSDSLARSLDTRPEGFVCRVQVKAIEKAKRRREQIKLDNWERMAKDPVPWFVVVFVFTRKQGVASIAEAYVIHIGAGHIRRTLERLRKLGSDEAARLHKHTIDLTWTDADRLERPEAAAFGAVVRRHAAPDARTYRDWKQKVVDEVGFDDERGVVRFDLAVQSQGDLADLVVGLRPELEISNLRIEQRRFGVLVETHRLERATLTALRANRPVPITLVVENLDTGNSMQLKGTAISAASFLPGLAREFEKVVIDGLGWRFVLLPDGQATLTWTLLPTVGRPRSLSESGRVARAIQVMAESTHSELRIEVGGVRSLSSRGPLDFGPDGRALAVLIAKAHWLAQRFGLDDLVLDKRLLQYIRKQADRIQSAYQALAPGARGELEVSLPQSQGELTGTMCALAVVGVEWPGVVTLATISFAGPITEHGASGATATAAGGHSVLNRRVLLRNASPRVLAERQFTTAGASVGLRKLQEESLALVEAEGGTDFIFPLWDAS